MASAGSLQAASSGGNDRFNDEAAKWDSNPMVHEASKQASKAIVAKLSTLGHPPASKHGPDVLEIGCGTGLLSFIMAPHVNRIVAVDAAPGMIDVLKAKLQKPDAPRNIMPVAVLLEDPEDESLPPQDEKDPDGRRLKFDLITSHLVLHHIPDLKAVLATMLGCLKNNGWVALTDFEDYGPEAKAFHPKSKMAGVERHGINASAMEKLMNEVGFVNVRVERAWSMDRNVEKFEGEFGDSGQATQPGQGEVRNFPFVLCMGQRKDC